MRKDFTPVFGVIFYPAKGGQGYLNLFDNFKNSSLSFTQQFKQLSVSLIMKKGTSISLVLLMIAVMLHFSVAAHYCGGKVVASQVSLTGKLANCGMEGSEKELPLHGINLSKHCCDDVLISFLIDNNYTPSFPVFQNSFQDNFQILSIQAEYPVLSLVSSNLKYTNASPPGVMRVTNVDLSDICVFRI
jgi:hypothetical protein